MSIRQNLEKLLETGQENALLHYSLGVECLKEDDPLEAVTHLSRSLELDPEYSAAWKLYAKSLAVAGNHREALDAFDTGIAVAERKGDIQAAKEMKVFRKRSLKVLSE